METRLTGDAPSSVGSTDFSFGFSARGRLDNISAFSDNIDFWHLRTISANRQVTIESSSPSSSDRSNYLMWDFGSNLPAAPLPVPHSLSIWDSSGSRLATSTNGSVSYVNRSTQDLWVSVEHSEPMNGSFRGIVNYYIYDLEKSTTIVAPIRPITPANRDPVALDDTATATVGQTVTINIGSNDSDADGDRLATTGLTGFFDAPRQGTVSYTDNFFSPDTVRYTPFSTATGTDSFRYQVSDGKGGTDTAESR